MGLETVPCAICGDSPLRTLDVTPEGLGIVECERCGLAFVSPRLDGPALDAWYQKVGDEGIVYDKVPVTAPFDLEHFKSTGRFKTHQMMLDLVRSYKPSGEVLEIGCGHGLFLKLAALNGYRVLGTEVSDTKVQYAKRELGVEVKLGYLEQLDVPDARFDVVLTWDVLEHLPDPLAYLRFARAKLGPDGLLFGQVPNYDGLVNRVRTFLSRHHLTRRPWPHFGLPQHIYWFTPRTMGLLMAKAGLELVNVRAWSHLKYTLEPSLLDRFVSGALERRLWTSYFVFVARRAA